MALPELLYHLARVVWTGLFFLERAWITSFVEFACLGEAAPNSRHHVLVDHGCGYWSEYIYIYTYILIPTGKSSGMINTSMVFGVQAPSGVRNP